MKKIFFSIFLLSILVSCKTKFEQIRTSNDPEAIYESATKYYKEGDYLKAQSLYELVIPYYRGKAEAEDVFYKYAYTHYHTNQFILASHYFSSFGKTFYNSPKKEEVEFMAAYSNILLSPNHKLDQTYSQKAVEELQGFINKYPQSDRVEECNKLIDELRLKMEDKAFEQGRLYYDLNNYISAITSFDNMLRDYPESKKTEEVRYLSLKASFKWAENSVYTKKQERYNETIKRAKQFMNKYKRSKYSDEVSKISEKSQKIIKTIKNV